jgi:hypothetical protein
MLDDVSNSLDNTPSLNNFNQMSANEKLQTLQQRTKDLFNKARKFDERMQQLNK